MRLRSNTGGNEYLPLSNNRALHCFEKQPNLHGCKRAVFIIIQPGVRPASNMWAATRLAILAFSTIMAVFGNRGLKKRLLYG